jgi:hypothetical protein
MRKLAILVAHDTSLPPADQARSVEPVRAADQGTAAGAASGSAGLSIENELATAVTVVFAGFLLGMLTAYAQGWLPAALSPLANSSGSWVIVAFALALLGRGPWRAIGYAAIALIVLLAGYVVADDLRGLPSSLSTNLFWIVAAVLGGPVLGVAAHWVRFGSRKRVAVGTGVISGTLIGEGLYGLTTLGTHQGYWYGQIAVAAILLLGLARARFRSPVAAVLAILATALLAAAFLAAYWVGNHGL